MIVRRAQKLRKQLVTDERTKQAKDNASVLAQSARNQTPCRLLDRVAIDVLAKPASGITPGIQLSDKCDPSGGFGRLPASAGRALGSRAIPQAKPRTSETPSALPALAGSRGTKKRLRARWIRMPDRGSLWLLPSGPDQIRNMSSSEPIERARRSIYLTRSRPMGQDS